MSENFDRFIRRLRLYLPDTKRTEYEIYCFFIGAPQAASADQWCYRLKQCFADPGGFPF
jgi:hypothetical protein